MASLLKRALLVLLLAITLLPATVDAGDPVFIAASILRGEAPEDCVRCREMTACALVRDLNRGVALRKRWYGWRTARDEDVALIERAQENGFCALYPECKFVGNGRDLEVWARRGWASGVQVVAYCGTGGCSVCVPEMVAGEAMPAARPPIAAE